MSAFAEILTVVTPAAAKPSRHDPRLAGPLPWTPGDLGRLTLFLGLGGVTLAAAWIGASGTDNYAAQLSWVALGIAALILSGIGGALWILAGFRNTRARQRVVAASTYELLQRPVATVTERVIDPLVAVDAGTRYHRRNCALVSGKRTADGSRAAHESTGLRPCGVCQP